ncbi:hypothetical protein [Pyxidicoccus trucidator]|uniref:hypothetical protein n=1 Tax=Pyxidicoccus trucidator TaxID=2709662 RepID=UPI0013DAA540|nr:hypothetical protein [Pyxidicoccus trucidator]
MSGGLKGEEGFALGIGGGDSGLNLEVGTLAEFICRPGRPAFRLRYASSGVRVEVGFVVGHSCLNELAVDLERILALARAV